MQLSFNNSQNQDNFLYFMDCDCESRPHHQLDDALAAKVIIEQSNIRRIYLIKYSTGYTLHEEVKRKLLT